jgi:hypothetical protein
MTSRPRPGYFPLVLLSALLLLAGGCGGAKVCRVTGTVRHNGKPVPDLFINFVPAEGRPSWGITDETGRYKLMYDKKREGAVRGAHKVYFEFRPRDPAQEVALHQGKLRPPAAVQAVLAKHGSEATALRYEVAANGQVIDIDAD